MRVASLRTRMLAVLAATMIVTPAALVSAQLGQEQERDAAQPGQEAWAEDNLVQKWEQGQQVTLRGEVINLHEYMTGDRDYPLGIEREEEDVERDPLDRPDDPVQEDPAQQPGEFGQQEDPAQQPGAQPEDPADEPLGIERERGEDGAHMEIYALKTERGIVILNKHADDHTLGIEREEEHLDHEREEPLGIEREEEQFDQEREEPLGIEREEEAGVDAEAEVEVDLEGEQRAEFEREDEHLEREDEVLGIERERERDEMRLDQKVGQETTLSGTLYFRDGVHYFVVDEVTEEDVEEPLGIEREEEVDEFEAEEDEFEAEEDPFQP